MPNLVNDFEVRKETLRALGGDPTGLANIYEVDLEILKLIGSSEQGIPDAPIDGVQYARQNGEWTPVESGVDWNTIKQKLAEDGVESIKFIMGAEQVILTASEVKNLLNQTVLPDAPSDGKQYARQNGNWTPVESVEPGIPDAPSDGKQYARQDGTWTPVEEGLTDAPSDGKTYGRNNGAWSVVEKGILDAPIDGVQYARQDGAWTPVEIGLDWNTIKQKLAEDGVESIKFIMAGEEIILTASEVKNLLNQTVLPDAPIDGVQYARQNGEWTPVESGGSVIPKGKYMTITVDDEVEGETIISPTVNGSLPNLNLQYRINNGEWSDFIVGTTADIHVVSGDFVQFKGINESGISNSTSNYLNFAISGNPVHLSGNVMSLIDGVGDTKDIPNKFCFFSLFKGSNVKTVSSDFLPVITLSDYCYCAMFQGCSNLVKAPELPATVLKIRCYYNMFWGCSSLVQAPELPATVLAVGCYIQMFYGCSNLVQAPLLPATELVGNCYDSMFYECKSLKYVKSLAVEVLDSSTIGTWLYNVASSGTFEKPAGVVYKTGSSGIPEGWTVKEFDMYIEAPKDGKQYARQDGNWTPVESVEPGIPDAPSDGKTYGRNNGTWTPVENGILDAPSDGNQYARQNGNWTPVEEGLPDAPKDGKQYARQDGNWTPVESVEPGISDAPSDGKQYARQDGAWSVVEKGILDAPIDGVQYARHNGEWTPVERGLDWNTIKQKLAEDGVESIKFIMGAEEVILTASEVKTLLNQTVLPDAPSDGQQYARQDGAWTVVESVEPGISDAPSDGKTYGRNNGAWTPVEEGITDSPSDGQQYARQDGAWTPVEEGIPEAPLDGQKYSRKNAAWTPVEEGIPEAPLDGLQYARQEGAWVEVSKVKTTNNTMLQFWKGTQQEYDAIVTKDANTLYIIS